MTSTDAASYGPNSPWQRYLDNEHRARDQYLSVVARAHFEYLTGPYPDRDAYTTVERQAWLTYYHAGRDAWHAYRAELDNPTPPPPPPPPPSHPYPVSSYLVSGHNQPGPRSAFTAHGEDNDQWLNS